MKIQKTLIKLERIKLYAHHGVDPQEQETGAYFYVTLDVTADFSEAISTDQLRGTVSYADLYECVREEMAVPSQLLEHVAGRILRHIYERFQEVSKIRIILTKENPPMGAECQSAGIEIDSIR